VFSLIEARLNLAFANVGPIEADKYDKDTKVAAGHLLADAQERSGALDDSIAEGSAKN
jgi:hypothetical protein